MGAVEPIPFSVFQGPNRYLEVRIYGEVLTPRRRLVSAPFALKAEGEVPAGALVLAESSADPAITGLGYTEQGDTIGPYYLYQKDAYNPAAPRVPPLLSYQGQVLPLAGATVGAAADFTFAIQDADTAGTATWSESRAAVPLVDGLFAIQLGLISPVYPAYLSGKDLWLDVTLQGQALRPRQKLTAAPYAIKIESPAPPGAMVLSATASNPDLIAKKFIATGAAVDGYFLFKKSPFSSADASVPLLISHQGRLLGPGGEPPSSVDLRFGIFDSATAAAPLWSETVSAVTITDGIYNVLLGGSNPIGPDALPAPNAFLEVTVTQGSTSEVLSPRTRLTSVPFALQAEGTLPPSALILGATPDDPAFLNSGFKMTGDTVSGYYVYGKTELDTTPPVIEILSPLYGMTTGSTLDISITYSDDLSGVDLSTLAVYHNGMDITSTLTVTESGASGSIAAVEGGNNISVELADNAMNAAEVYELVIYEGGNPPDISILSPLDGTIVFTNTPTFIVTYSDGGCGVDTRTLSIRLNGSDKTDQFMVTPTGAYWEAPSESALSNGPYTLAADVQDFFGAYSLTAYSAFTVSNSYSHPILDDLSPNFTIGGDVVTLTGTGFGSTIGVSKVFFTGVLGKVQAEVVLATQNQLNVIVPGGALTGQVWVENTVDGSPVRSNELDFTLGLPYAYITNRGSDRIVRIDYRTNTVSGTILLPGSNNQSYGADVTPDGRWLFVANKETNTVTVIDTLDNHIVNNIDLRCHNEPGAIKPDDPFAIAITPDGSRAMVVTNYKQVSVIEIRKVVPDTLSADSVCASVSNYQFSAGASYQDVDFTPDGTQAIIGTDGSATQGYVIALDTERTYISSANTNLDYMSLKQFQLPAGAGQNPQGAGMSPFKNGPGFGDELWYAIIANMGTATGDMNSVILNLPPLDFSEIIDINKSHPVCYGAKDVTVSNHGDRAFFGFYNSNNIGVVEGLTSSSPKEIKSATINRTGCPPNCTGPGIREMVYTPYLDKVIAPIWYNDQANSKVMILNAAAVPVGYTGTIPASAYTFVQSTSMIGPEGVGIYPLFDRDGDKISDLVESSNNGWSFWSGFKYDFQPTEPNPDISQAGGIPNSGYLVNGVQTPQEGIGYYHFHGQTEGPHEDNWGTLTMIKVIEQVGREWNQRHPEGPRIGIGDMSLKRGGQFCWMQIDFIPPSIDWICHKNHQNGLDADIRYIRSDGAEQGFTFKGTGPFPTYSQSLTQEMIGLFCQAGVTLIYADTSERDGLIQPTGCVILRDEPGHNNHLHIQISGP